MVRRLRNMTLRIKDAEIVQAQLPSTDVEGIAGELEISTCGGTYCESTYSPFLDLEAATVTKPVIKGS